LPFLIVFSVYLTLKSGQRISGIDKKETGDRNQDDKGQSKSKKAKVIAKGFIIRSPAMPRGEIDTPFQILKLHILRFVFPGLWIIRLPKIKSL